MLIELAYENMSIVGKLEDENTVKQLDLEPGIQFKDQSDPLFLGTLELRINTKVAAINLIFHKKV